MDYHMGISQYHYCKINTLIQTKAQYNKQYIRYNVQFNYL